MSVTIYDIARETGVSHATVSRVLNGGNLGKRGDAKARAKRVLEAADKMGYEPDSSAQSLTTRRTGNICFILSDHIEGGWRNSFYADYLTGVEKSCLKNSYSLMINIFKLDCFKTFFMERGIGQRKFDGLVITGYVTDEMAELLNQHQVPFVSTGTNLGRKYVPSLYCSDIRLGTLRYALSKGHRRVGFSSPSHGRHWAAELQEKVAADPELKDVELVDFPVKNQDSAASSLIYRQWSAMEPAERPTLLVQGYQTAACFLDELNENGFRCPDDVSLICSSEDFVCSFLKPPLTVVANDVEKQGEVMADILIEHLENGEPLVTRQLDIPIKIIERKSVKDLSIIGEDNA